MEMAAPAAQGKAAAMRAAMADLEVHPPTVDERAKACRSLVRYSNKMTPGHEQIHASEDWVRLYVALRRVRGEHARVSEIELRDWKASVSAATTITRKCFIVERERLDRLPTWPPGLEEWVIPHGELDLPADIYADDTIIIDDGYDRTLLGVPVLHLELSVRWNRKQTAGASAATPTTAAPAARGNLLPRLHSSGSAGPHCAGSAPAAEGEVPARAAAPVAEDPTDISEGSDMYHIVQSTLKAVNRQHWANADTGQPDTVEFWLRLFTSHMKRSAPSAWGEAQMRYLQYITKVVFEACDENALLALHGHLRELMGVLGEEATPPLTQAVIRLGTVGDLRSSPLDGAGEIGFKEFRDWASKKLSLQQLQKLYNSNMYTEFLKRRFQCRLDALRNGCSSGSDGRSSGSSKADKSLSHAEYVQALKAIRVFVATHMPFNSLDFERVKTLSPGFAGIHGGIGH